MASLPSILPRSAALFGGLSFMARRFETGPTLQRENAIGRIGPSIVLESFPLLAALTGWPRRIGIAAAYTMEFGGAGVKNPDGSTTSFPVRQSRWYVDARYAFTPGTHVVLIPLFGVGHSYYDLRRNMPATYSGCLRSTGAEGQAPCLPDSPLTYLRLGLLTRIAINETVALSIELDFQPVLGVGKAPGELGNEAQAVQSLGYAADVGLTWAQSSWLDWRIGIPVSWYGLRFNGPNVMATYPTGKEMYYGVVVGIVAHTM